MGWVGTNSWMDFPLFFATSGPTKRRKHYFWLLFSQYWTCSNKSQCSRHFSKKSIPGLPHLEPHRNVNATTLELFATNFKNFTKNGQLVFKLWFCVEIRVSKNPGFVPGSPPGGVYIPEKTPPKKHTGKWQQHNKLQFVDKMSSFCWAPCIFWGGPMGSWIHGPIGATN